MHYTYQYITFNLKCLTLDEFTGDSDDYNNEDMLMLMKMRLLLQVLGAVYT